MNQKGFNTPLLVVILVLLAGGLLLFSKGYFNKGATTLPNTPSPSLKAVADNNDTGVRIYPSLDNQYFFYITPIKGSNSECSYHIIDKEGYSFVVNDAMHTDRISCAAQGWNITSSVFKGWADGERFLVEKKDGEISVIGVNSFRVEQTYQYDSDSLNFVGANKTLKYWLFEKEPKYSYVLLDDNNKIVKENINFNANGQLNYGGYGVFYDDVNDGFLFISSQGGEKVSFKFDFLSTKNLSFRTLLTTDPVGVVGRGCGGNKLVSKPNEIIFASSCVTVDKKYISQDGYIHIPL